MFAIKLSEANMDTILKKDRFSEDEKKAMQVYLHIPKEFYLITGFVSRNGGGPENFSVMPKNVFEECFEHDPVKIQHDWDLIVRNQ
jgi:hypothetical protein